MAGWCKEFQLEAADEKLVILACKPKSLSYWPRATKHSRR